MRISDWSSDVCSSDLAEVERQRGIFEIVALVRERLGRTHQAEQIDALGLAHARCGGALAAEHDDRVEPVLRRRLEIGRASCRESVCQYVLISLVDVCLKNNKTILNIKSYPTKQIKT